MKTDYIWPKVAAGAILLGIAALITFIALNNSPAPTRVAGLNSSAYPEIEEIQAKQISSFKDLTKYFTALAEKKGGEYAFKVLLVTPLPPNIDMHLMGHTVGDVLYKQQGVEGIKVCTQDFRNACSHSIVVGLLLEKGEGVMPQITDACKQAPGGGGAYTMCFHGLGHGVLAYTGYDMPKAVKLCEKAGTKEYNGQEGIECIGGTVMEIIGGGFHNPELWATQSKKYLPESNPLLPCASDYMPENAKVHCYLYLTPRLFIAAGGQQALGSPTPDDFEKAFRFCDAIPEKELGSRRACYGGFGKEFIVLAKDRDIRNIDKMTSKEMRVAYDWCRLAKDNQQISWCVENIAGSIYWGGENDKEAVIRFCGVIDDLPLQDACFGNIIGLAGFYVHDNAYHQEFCSALPARHQSYCRDTLLGR